MRSDFERGAASGMVFSETYPTEIVAECLQHAYRLYTCPLSYEWERGALLAYLQAGSA